jgi:hypothetical protein
VPSENVIQPCGYEQYFAWHDGGCKGKLNSFIVFMDLTISSLILFRKDETVF